MIKRYPIKQIDPTNNEIINLWSSVAEAARNFNIDETCIRNACKGKLITFKGFKWRYQDQELASKYIYREKPKPKETKKILEVIYNNTEKKFEIKNEYNSCKETAKKFNTTEETIRSICWVNARNKIIKYYGKDLIFVYKNNWEMFLIKANEVTDRCKICGNFFPNLRSLSTHIYCTHKITIPQYTIDYLLNRIRPKCAKEDCDKEPRYATYSFKKYCIEHSYLAEQEGGKKGGEAPAWNRGKTKHDDTRIMKQAIEMSGNRNHFFGKHHSEETRKYLSKVGRLSEEEIHKRLEKRSDDFTFGNFNYNDYISRQHQKIECTCIKCKHIFYKTLQALERGSLCSRCYPFTVSRAEIEIGDYIEKELNVKVVRNDRKIIGPRELDIFVPSHSFAIEYNGLYWHMETPRKGYNKFLQYEKLCACKERNIELFNIFSDEWENKQELVKSMIRNRLGLSERKVGARKYYIQEVKEDIAKDFYEKNHISGYSRSIKSFALIPEKGTFNDIVSMLSLRKAFHKKYNNSIEISRFASRIGYSVQGGFSKLLGGAKKYAEKNNYKSIVSYCDRRFGEGNVYIKNGFNLISETNESFWYTDGLIRYDRFKFRAKDGYSEKKIARQNRVKRIYGCGNNLYEFLLT